MAKSSQRERVESLVNYNTSVATEECFTEDCDVILHIGGFGAKSVLSRLHDHHDALSYKLDASMALGASQAQNYQLGNKFSTRLPKVALSWRRCLLIECLTWS